MVSARHVVTPGLWPGPVYAACTQPLTHDYNGTPLDFRNPQTGTFKKAYSQRVILLTHGLIETHIITLQSLFSWLSLCRETEFSLELPVNKRKSLPRVLSLSTQGSSIINLMLLGLELEILFFTLEPRD